MQKRIADWPRRAEITIHKVPVVGFVGFVFAIGIVVIAFVGLPVAKWFLLASLIAGVVVFGIIRFAHKMRSRTEEEEVQLNVGRQTRQP
jgi:small-conductance mechanosensitive channel